MKIKITLTYHFTSIKMAIIRNLHNVKYYQGCEKVGTFMAC